MNPFEITGPSGILLLFAVGPVMREVKATPMPNREGRLPNLEKPVKQRSTRSASAYSANQGELRTEIGLAGSEEVTTRVYEWDESCNLGVLRLDGALVSAAKDVGLIEKT